MINIIDKSGKVRYSTEINEGSKRKFSLMKEDYVLLKFSMAEPVYFKLGDSIEDKRFELIEPYKPSYNDSTGGYDYELRLDAYYWKWKNKKFFFNPQYYVDFATVVSREASWNLTAPLSVHLDHFLKNLEFHRYKYSDLSFKYAIDPVVEKSAKLVQYDQMNLIDALGKMAETWECEWWVHEHTIHFGRCEFTGSPAVDLEYGANVETMSCSGSRNTYATRIYAFGSTRNLPSDYRSMPEDSVLSGIAEKRLMMETTPYVDAYSPMPAEEAVEEIVIFEDIYPQYEGKIETVVTHEYTDKIEEEGKDPVYQKWDAYRFTDSDHKIHFSKDYVLPGEELRIVFQSGALNGMDFAVAFNPCDKQQNEKAQPEKNPDGSWNGKAQVFEILRNETYGRKLPDELLRPRGIEYDGEGKVSYEGDSYVLYGYDTEFVNRDLLQKAENELRAKAEAYLEKTKVDPCTYECRMMSDYMQGKKFPDEFFEIGTLVNLIHPAYFEKSRVSRIIGFEYNLDIPSDSPVYTVGETASYSRLGNLESKVDALTYKGEISKGGEGCGIYVVRTDDNTYFTDRNVWSSRRGVKEVDERALSRLHADTAQEMITFNNGAVFRSKTSVPVQEVFSEVLTVDADAREMLSDHFVEDNEQVATYSSAVLEAVSTGNADTIGELGNVAESADEAPDGSVLMMKSGMYVASLAYREELDLLNSKVFPFTMALFGGGTYEKGSTQVITLSWTYDRAVDSQSVNNEPLATGVRTKQYSGVVADTTYTLRAVCKTTVYTQSLTARFCLKKYYGVSSKGTLTNAEILSLSSAWAQPEQEATLFDCTGGKYPYYILPTSMAGGVGFWVGGLKNTDWTKEVRKVTNASGYEESYTLFRLRGIQTGILSIEVK